MSSCTQINRMRIINQFKQIIVANAGKKIRIKRQQIQIWKAKSVHGGEFPPHFCHSRWSQHSLSPDVARSQGNPQSTSTLIYKCQCKWNGELKLWCAMIEQLKYCFNQLDKYFEQLANDQQQRVHINRIPDFVFKANNEMGLELQVRNGPYSVAKSINYNSVQTQIDARVLPFYQKLYDFQKQSLNFSIKRHGRLLLADEMGVGKTIQSLAMLSIYRHDWPFLIICPSSLRLNWQQQVLTWLDDYVKKHEIQVYSKGRTPIKQNIKVLIVSYDLAWRMRDMLDSFKAVIADEAHYLKNTGNKRSDILLPFLSSRKRVILLTGTPALAKPRQIYNLVSIIRPDVFINFKQFGYRYCEPSINPWSRALEYNGCQNTKQLHYLLKDKIMIRRLKKQVLTQLPDKQRQKVMIETDKAVIKEIKELLGNSSSEGNNFQKIVVEMLSNFNSDLNSNADDRSAMSKAYSLTAKAKLESAKEYIFQLLQNNVKLIVFAHHKVMLDGLEDAMKQKGYKYMRIDGTVSSQNRHERVKNFQEDEKIVIALLSITAAGVGLTLTASSTIVFTELHWTPGIMTQAQDRAHRIGQKNSVNCHYLIGQNTLDEMLYRYLEKKISNVASFVEGKGQKLEIESLSKGQKGKYSVNSGSNEDSQHNGKSILFKFESIKPIVDKYFYNKSQDTEISDQTVHESVDDIESEIDGIKKRKKRQALQISQESLRKEQQTEVKQKKERTQEEQIVAKINEQQQLNLKETSSIDQFIIQNAKQLMSISSSLQSDEDSEYTQ